MVGSPYQNPYNLNRSGAIGSLYENSVSAPQTASAPATPTAPQQAVLKSRTFPDGSMLLDPGEPVPEGYVIEETRPDGRVSVVPAPSGGSGGGGSGAGGAGGGGLGSLAAGYLMSDALGGGSSLAAPTLISATRLGVPAAAAAAAPAAAPAAAGVAGAAPAAAPAAAGAAPATGTLASALPYLGPAAAAAGILYGIHQGFGGGRPSTKDLQAKRSARLAKEDPSYASHQQAMVDLSESNAANQKKAWEATGDDYVGFWDDPSTPNNDYIWVNKKAGPQGARKEDQGVGDLMFQPWFFENFENWDNLTMEQRNAIVQKAMESGTRKDSAGMIDFTLTPELKEEAKKQGVKVVRYTVPTVKGGTYNTAGQTTVTKAPKDEGEKGYTSDQIPTAKQVLAWGKIPTFGAQAWANQFLRKRRPAE